MTPKRTRKTGEIQGIAFDAFGTLCQAAPIGSLLRWHSCLASSDRRRLRNDWMCGRIGYAELVAHGDTEAAPPADVLEHQARAAASTTRVYKIAIPVLDELLTRGYPMVIVSNLAPPYGAALRKLLSPWADHFVLSYEVGAQKPDSIMFERAAAAMELPMHRVLMVGDSPRSDIDGANNAGMPALLVGHTDSVASISDVALHLI